MFGLQRATFNVARVMWGGVGWDGVWDGMGCGAGWGEEDSEGPVQMAYLENAVEIPPPMREEVVSPSQSAFGLRAYEDEGEDGEGEAPSEEEEDFEEADIGEDDWDTELGLEPLDYGDLAIRLNRGGGGGPANGRRGGSGGGGAEPSPVSAGAGAFSETAQPSDAGGSSDMFSDARASATHNNLAVASGSDDVDTDWDREFFGAGTGRTGEPSPNEARDVTRANIAKGLKALLNGAPEPAAREGKAEAGVSGAGGGLTGVPDKCRVVGRLLKGGRAGPAVTIVKYPRACHLICLRVGAEASKAGMRAAEASTDRGVSSGEALTPSKGKGRAMHGQRMVEWLEGLISKRADLFRSKSELRAANSRLVKGLQVMEKRLNPRNTKVFLECSMSTWRLGERESCVSVLKSYFQILRMQSRMNARKATQGGGGGGSGPALGSETGNDTYTMFREAFSLVELRATVHHLGEIVAAGRDGDESGDSSSQDSGMGDMTGYGGRGMAGRGDGGGGGTWDQQGSEEGSGDWGVEYSWSAQGGAGRHQAPTLVHRMPQAICNNYLRVREGGRGGGGVRGERGEEGEDKEGKREGGREGGRERGVGGRRERRRGKWRESGWGGRDGDGGGREGGREGEQGDRSGGLGSSGGQRGGGSDFRSGTRSPSLPSPTDLLLRSLSSSSAISRVSSHFSHFNSNAAPVELQLPSFRRPKGNAAETDETARIFGGAGGGGGGAGDVRPGASGGTLDPRSARAKYLPTGGVGAAGVGAGGGGGGGATDNASRVAKSKPQWGWAAGKSIFGRRAVVDGKRAGAGGAAELEAAQPAPAPPSPSTGALSNNSGVVAVGGVTPNVSTSGTGGPAGSGGGSGGGVTGNRARDGLDPPRKATDNKRQGAGRRLASDTGGTYREPGGERGRGSRSAAEQRTVLDRVGGGREVAGARVRDRRPRQSRSVDSPGRVAKGAATSGADAAAEAAHGFFSDAARRERRVSPSPYRSGGDRERGEGETRSEARKRRSPVQAGTRRERENTRRPSRTARPRTRSEERLSRREGRQWSDLANPRPPLPHPSPAPDNAHPAALLKRTGGGSGGVSAASPANSSNGTSDDKSRASRVDDNSSGAGWGTSSLAGWGETMAAEAEAEVLGRPHRGGDKRRNGRYGGGGGGAGGTAGGAGGGGTGDKAEAAVDPTLRGQPERTRLHQMVAALTDLCMYLVGVSPLSMEECPSMLEHLPNDDDDWDEDDTFDDSSIFSVGSVGSATTNGAGGGRVPSSPSTLGAMDQSDDEEEDEDLRGRWGNNGVVVGGGEEKRGDSKPEMHEAPTTTVAAVSAGASVAADSEAAPPRGAVGEATTAVAVRLAAALTGGVARGRSRGGVPKLVASSRRQGEGVEVAVEVGVEARRRLCPLWREPCLEARLEAGVGEGTGLRLSPGER
eukprot:jgi/Undpi1/2003/HiC_scaffold_12.g05390.m1